MELKDLKPAEGSRKNRKRVGRGHAAGQGTDHAQGDDVAVSSGRGAASGTALIGTGAAAGGQAEEQAGCCRETT